MTAQSAGPAQTRRPGTAESVVNFVPEAVKAPFLLRLGAVFVDYILIVAFPTLFLILSRFSGLDGAALINSDLNNIGWLLAILIGISNLILLPAICARSIGKFVTGLQIVSIKGSPPTLRSILLRQTVGYLLVIGSFGLAFLTVVFSRKGRALHDYLVGTMVIYANKRQR
ncbi:MAG TPA: RDD family protein [Pyrinomonadaceae bacterium]|nr:RDD family protein [Pyrinomonadaceae bacterium]HMP66214.1 RDD family protein [Pyrinomonadaceae bacterium]